MPLTIEGSFITIIIILMMGIVLGALSNKTRIPEVVLYLLGGILLGPELLGLVTVADSSMTNQLILIFGASFLLYIGGREIDLKVLDKIKISVISLSTFGVLISMGVLAVLCHYLLHLSWAISALIGAVTASTDPATLIPIFRKVKVREDLRQTIIAESAFNDAMGTIVSLATISIIVSGQFILGESLLDFSKLIFIGIIVGMVVGFATSFLICSTKFGFLRDFAPIASLITVLASYSIAEAFDGSGYMATFTAGIICGNKNKFGLTVPEKPAFTQGAFREVLGDIMKMMIFILLGSHIQFSVIKSFFIPCVVISLLLIFVARPVSVFASTIIDRKAKWTFKEMLFMSWVRETGVIPAAMSSLLVSMNLPGAQEVSSVVFMVIIITLLVQAPSTGKVVEELKIEA